ncbi:hypothetical protein Forpi1262_v018645 [Fusarium oxysporum f. sp. raphani]|uniref:Uncharacterized protein n=1 Tax=Fusarium oxysporum f. sp. raphani TaxID=96318 RepID=A0A8J5NGW7_FUSOX|nr:hypothetical protein Forpi1262_v018645 [Fusarium oxysporum f. sp. raphani]
MHGMTLQEKRLELTISPVGTHGFKLLDAAISQEGPLSIFLNQYHEELEDDILTHDDWQVLKMTHEFLQPFYQATLEQQMEWASIDQVLENMDILFLQFENAKVKYVNNARMVNSVHMGWWVLSKYYEESDKTPYMPRHYCSIQKNAGGTLTAIGQRNGDRPPLLVHDGMGEVQGPATLVGLRGSVE